MTFKDKKYNNQYHLNYYHKRRKWFIDYLGGKCIICGSTENLEFDHIDPQTKLLNPKEAIRLTKEKAFEEIDKCQLLCESHHIHKTNSEKTQFNHGTVYAWMKKKCRCNVCEPVWRKWNDDRNIKRRLT